MWILVLAWTRAANIQKGWQGEAPWWFPSYENAYDLCMSACVCVSARASNTQSTPLRNKNLENMNLALPFS